jgi:hypothetical protein
MIATPLLPDFLTNLCVASRMALRAATPGRLSFHDLAFLRVGMIASAPRCAMASWEAFVSYAPSLLTRAIISS